MDESTGKHSSIFIEEDDEDEDVSQILQRALKTRIRTAVRREISAPLHIEPIPEESAS